MRFSSVTPRGEDERYRIQTRTVGRLAPATKEKDAVTIGAPAFGGALVGGLVGGGKGAAIGAAAGGGAGTAVVLSTRGKEVRLGRGQTVLVRLTQPLRLRVRS
jgi:predicted lipid-binding transport protein (Tim44 family)